LLSAAGLRRDVAAAERAIRDATGVDPRPWFRCPFGDGADSPRVLGTLAALGYRDTGWTVDSRDWTRVSARTLERRVVDQAIEAGDGAVVLLHGWPVATAAALPAILRRLTDAGATFVRLDALAPAA
jgi:peptidoglycan/xylan/chitin deacetylase (PgdA/CDA1 family)